MGIQSIEELREYLQNAIELEHATIPVYMSALYTIMPSSNQEAYYVIRSVLMEEMLHMTLAANVLNAIGGSPSINHPKFVPSYPTYLPHSNKSFLVNLMPFSKKAIDMFLKIEQPTDPANMSMEKNEDGEYPTIGAFYKAIEEGLKAMVEQHGETAVFSGDQQRQITAEMFYGSGGRAIEVTDLKSALFALEVIIDQGEGVGHSLDDGDAAYFGQDAEVAHYYRFNQILMERYYKQGDTIESGPRGDALHVDWDKVYNSAENPKTVDYKDNAEVLQKSQEFNETYTNLLNRLHDAFNGQPKLLEKAVASMMELKYKALELFKNPYPNKPGYQAAPTFELV